MLRLTCFNIDIAFQGHLDDRPEKETLHKLSPNYEYSVAKGNMYKRE